MKKHLKYLSYVLRHKWYVFIECCKLGIPWRGLVHDLSKFHLSEWFPYIEKFYGNNSDSTAFNLAWLHHQHHNPHHWQWWVDRDKVFPMPLKYRKEMLADWIGAGKAQGNPNTREWYLKNRDSMILHVRTKLWIEHELGVL